MGSRKSPIFFACMMWVTIARCVSCNSVGARGAIAQRMRRIGQLGVVLVLLLAMHVPMAIGCWARESGAGGAGHACCHRMMVVACGLAEQRTTRQCCEGGNAEKVNIALPSRQFELRDSYAVSGTLYLNAVASADSVIRVDSALQARPPGNLKANITPLRI